MADIIEGKVEEPTEAEYEEMRQEVASMAADANAVAVFNPLDAEPVNFKRQLEIRQENYDALQMHLQGVLVAGKDFGRIRVKKNSDQLSGYMLFAPGADKILGILGLGVHYPDLKDYKRAVLQGYTIEEIIVDCQILGLSEQVIAEGAGACSRSEPQIGDLNRCIKRACKRARLDAVLRLPVVSALFEGDFLAKMAAAQERKGENSATKRSQQFSGKKWDTGTKLEVCPIGNEIKGKPWHEIDTGALQWLMQNVTDKPDITRAVAEELTKRNSATDSSSQRTQSSPAFNHDDQGIENG